MMHASAYMFTQARIQWHSQNFSAHRTLTFRNTKRFFMQRKSVYLQKTDQIKLVSLSQIDHITRAYTYLHNFIASYFCKTFICQILGFEKSYETRRLMIRSDTTCGRTARNSTLPKALVFHQTLSTPKVSYIGRFYRAHPKGELE